MSVRDRLFHAALRRRRPSGRRSSASLSHRLWVRRILPGDLPFLPTVVIMTIVGYFACAAGALLTGWFWPYLRSPAFLLGCAGISWVLCAVRNRSRTVDRLYTNVSDAFELSTGARYTEFIEREFSAISNPRSHALVALPIAVTFVVAGWAAFFAYPFAIAGLRFDSLRPWVFDPELYVKPHLHWKFMFVLAFAVAIAGCLGTAAWMMIRELVTVSRLRSLPPLLLPEITKSRLRKLADFHVRVSGDWGLGAVTFLILFWKNPDIFSIAVIGCLALVCGAMFFLPQILLARVVRNSYDMACSYSQRLLQEFRRAGAPDAASEAEMLAALSEITSRPKFLVYSTDELWRWVLAQGLAFVAVAIQISSAH